MVRASSREVSVVTLRAGGSWRSSTAEKRYLEGGETERAVLVLLWEDIIVVMAISKVCCCAGVE